MIKSHLTRYVQSVLPMPIGKAELIVENFQPGKFARNDFLLKEGTICNESHFIQQGFMRSFTHDPDGNEVTTGFFSKNM
jgi:CRP-like cAMP-binding protein